MQPLSDSAIRPPDLTAILLRQALRANTLFVGLIWVIAIFVSATRGPALISALIATALMVVLPWSLARKGAALAAAYAFVGATLTLTLVIYWLARGPAPPVVVMQLGVIMHAALLLGRKGVYLTAVPILALDLLKIVLQEGGMTIPLVFPGSPSTAWALMAATIVWTMPSMLLAMSTLRDSVEQLRGHVKELQEANQRFTQSEELRQLISETVPVGILVFDPEGRNIFANSFAVARLGEEVRGMDRGRPPWPVTDYAGNPVPKEQRLFERVLATGKPLHGARICVERPAGHRLYLSVSIAPIHDHDGALRGVVSAFEDVTHSIEAEARHLHAQKLASMGELAGSIAHDFNNLLTVIRGDSELALKQSADNGPLRARLERIYKASDSAATLCRQLLTFARREDTAPHPISWNELLADNEDLLRGMLPPEVELQVRLGDVVPPVHAEAGLLLQVLTNLVVNARDAMPSGGALTIYTLADKSREVSLLVVEDTGVGMEPAMLESVFQPYYTTKRSGKGTGLGLAIVYAIVQQFGGWVRVESEPGKGSRFLVGLPWVK